MSSEFREIINPEKVFNVEGFTHVASPKGSKTYYLSGQLAWDENFQVVGEGNLEKQTAKVYENIEHILNGIGATWDHVVKTTIYTTEPYESETIAKVKQGFFKDVPPPTETMIGVTGLASPELLIEVEAIVVV